MNPFRLLKPFLFFGERDILNSSFYKRLVDKFGKSEADKMVNNLSSREFIQYFYGDNPQHVYNQGVKHMNQMRYIKDVEDAGGILAGSGQLASNGTVKRSGLLHDLDFDMYGDLTSRTSPVLTRLGYRSQNNNPNTILFGTGLAPRVPQKVIIGDGYVNIPQTRYGQTADMFIINQRPTKENIVNIILDAKKKFNRQKDIDDIKLFKPYSFDNPMIDPKTGIGQWNPTLFRNGIFDKDGYPIIEQVETYPNSGIFIPSVMNYNGQIKSVLVPRRKKGGKFKRLFLRNFTHA